MDRSKLLLLGASGHLGSRIAKALAATDYHTTAVVRTKEKGEALKPFIAEYIVADVLNPHQVSGITQHVSVVISALGKSVLPNSKDKQSFYEVDYKGNSAVLRDAIKTACKNLFMCQP
ncbi:MAG: NAD-dependent epimerase/dehydratase [Flavisolibacter sp.]|jgi:putative NADH-flavin reductase|nr:NAD-dependent epimerase/dehydratase [Flavisolibacter sp.]